MLKWNFQKHRFDLHSSFAKNNLTKKIPYLRNQITLKIHPQGVVTCLQTIFNQMSYT